MGSLVLRYVSGFIYWIVNVLFVEQSIGAFWVDFCLFVLHVGEGGMNFS